MNKAIAGLIGTGVGSAVYFGTKYYCTNYPDSQICNKNYEFLYVVMSILIGSTTAAIISE